MHGHWTAFTEVSLLSVGLSKELNTRGVAEFNDYRPIERYISETVQDRS